MESKRIFRDRQDLDPADFNGLQDYARRSLDHVVMDGVSAERKYAGFTASRVSTQQVRLAPGRLYAGGMVYDRAAEFTHSFTTTLPVAAKRIVLIVAFGQEVDTDEAPRSFLIDEETGAAEPQVVAQASARIAQVNLVTGVETADPVDPPVAANLLPIARIVLTPTGVESIVNLTDNRLRSVEDVAGDVAGLQAFQQRTGPAIAALGSDLATLREGVKNNVNDVAFGRALVRLASLEAKAGIPSTATNSSADYFLNSAGTDASHGFHNAKVAEGIRFGDQSTATSQLALLNPLNPAARVVGDVLFPAYSRELRMRVGPVQGEVRASAYTYASTSVVQRTMSRVRVRYGEEFTVCTNAGWWGAVTNRYIPETFQRAGENFQTVAVDWDGPDHGWVRVRRFWEDVYEEPYWDYVTTTTAIPGTQIAETFLNANDLWLDAVGLTFTRLAATGDATMLICEVDRSGVPDLGKVISRTTVLRSAMGTAGETVIGIQPAYLQGGRRYAIVFITAGDHYLATTQGENFTQGTFFYVLDGAYQQGDATRDLCFSLHAAKFTAARAVIDLQNLQLAGGMTSIDILAEQVRPGSTGLTFEVQVGGNWYPLNRVDQSILGAGGNIPPNVPLRAVFTGTPDAMPCLKLAGSQVKVTYPRNSLIHNSVIRTLPSPSSQIRVIVRLEYFVPANHAANAILLTGAGYATQVQPSSIVDVATLDGAIERTYVYNLGSAVSAYRICISASTTNVLSMFHHAWRKDYAI